MAKQALVVDIQNVDGITQMIQKLNEVIADLGTSGAKKHTNRKGVSVTDFSWKWTRSTQ